MIDNFEFTHSGESFIAEIHADDDSGFPWENSDGHGPVSEWTTRAKRAGEWVLDTEGRFKRFYDFAAACRIARRDGWNAAPYVVAGETARQKVERAAKADFDYLRGWCSGDWYYVGVVVRRADSCACCGASESLWGIESGDEWVKEAARELAGQLPARLAA
jgi:hypothetical protein